MWQPERWFVFGHGAVLNMNIPPDMTGTINVSVVDVMHQAGKAINGAALDGLDAWGGSGMKMDGCG